MSCHSTCGTADRAASGTWDGRADACTEPGRAIFWKPVPQEGCGGHEAIRSCTEGLRDHFGTCSDAVPAGEDGVPDGGTPPGITVRDEPGRGESIGV